MGSSFRTQPKKALDLSSGHCPADASEVADLYVLGRLTPEEAEIFEEHFLQCSECAEKAELAFEFSAAIKKYHA
jgi:hypothetical protein